MKSLLSFTDRGIYCEKAGLFIDPWRPVDHAVITHAHSDHAKWGMKHYLAHPTTNLFLKKRLGEVQTQSLDYGNQITMNGVKISLHPAGHVPGSAQVRLEYGTQVWVVSGDYKLENDPLAEGFEPVKCTHFITESTFGLPVYKWPDPLKISREINHWWSDNIQKSKTSILIGYSLGKSQRLLAGLDPSLGPIYTHGAVENLVEVYRQASLPLPETIRITGAHKKGSFKGAMVIAPPSALGSPWLKKFEPYTTGLASGWMMLRGTRRRRNVDRGFVMSDHADWEGLNRAVDQSEAENVYVTHGYTDTFSRWLNSRAIKASVVTTEFEGELSEIGESKDQEKESDEEL